MKSITNWDLETTFEKTFLQLKFIKMQKLMTKELQAQIPKLGSQEEAKENAIVYAHYFFGGWDWYVLEYDWENEFFGIVIGDEIEYWPFYLSEFADINKRAWYSKIERNAYFDKCKAIDIPKLKDFISWLWL